MSINNSESATVWRIHVCRVLKYKRVGDRILLHNGRREREIECSLVHQLVDLSRPVLGQSLRRLGLLRRKSSKMCNKGEHEIELVHQPILITTATARTRERDDSAAPETCNETYHTRKIYMNKSRKEQDGAEATPTQAVATHREHYQPAFRHRGEVQEIPVREVVVVLSTTLGSEPRLWRLWTLPCLHALHDPRTSTLQPNRLQQAS